MLRFKNRADPEGLTADALKVGNKTRETIQPDSKIVIIDRSRLLLM